MSGPHVEIGGRPYTVVRFKTYKAVLVGEVLSKVTKEVRGLFKEAAAFRAEYRQENSTMVTRQLCHERIAGLQSSASELRKQAEDAPESLTGTEKERVKALRAELEEMKQDDDRVVGHFEELAKLVTKDELETRAVQADARAGSWQQQLDDLVASDKEFVTIPQDPSEEELALAVFPKAFAMKAELAELLALVVTPDEDLRAEWRKDSVHEKLQRDGEDLIEKSEPDEMIQLILAAKQVVGDQFRPLAPALRSIWDGWTTQEPEKAKESEPESPAPTSDSPTSSTDSPAPTGGASSPSSSRSPGEPASVS